MHAICLFGSINDVKCLLWYFTWFSISHHSVVSRGDGLPCCLLTRSFLVDYQWRFIQTWRRELVYLTDSSKAILLLWIFYGFSVLCLLCLCARLFICALWSPAGKGLTSWLSFVVYNCDFVAFPLVSWVRCGAWLYRFLIFAPLLTSPTCLSRTYLYENMGLDTKRPVFGVSDQVSLFREVRIYCCTRQV